MYNYQLLDCGDQKKLEIFGNYKVIRPCPQAIWPITKPKLWTDVMCEFERTGKETGLWTGEMMPQDFMITNSQGLKWNVYPNRYGNMGVFTEHWLYATDLEKWFDKNGATLNLFSYSGSNCMNLLKKGFKITAVDSSKNSMDNYVANMESNDIDRDGQKLILEDVLKFISREERRGSKYSNIIMDAPSFGRGTRGEIFCIEDDLVQLLNICKNLLTSTGKMILTLHSPRFTPAILQILLAQMFKDKTVTVTETVQICQSGVGLPSGFLAKIY
jgi:23S rRNA (cytosine1962-C5)-methyltransferase